LNGVVAMAQENLTHETIEKVITAILEEAQANDALPEVVVGTMKRLRETDPKTAHAALRAMIETMAASLPADKRQKFLEELLVFLQSD
jgi:uncharacterized protein (DUF2267 family)